MVRFVGCLRFESTGMADTHRLAFHKSHTGTVGFVKRRAPEGSDSRSGMPQRRRLGRPLTAYEISECCVSQVCVHRRGSDRDGRRSVRQWRNSSSTAHGTYDSDNNHDRPDQDDERQAERDDAGDGEEQWHVVLPYSPGVYLQNT